MKMTRSAVEKMYSDLEREGVNTANLHSGGDVTESWTYKNRPFRVLKANGKIYNITNDKTNVSFVCLD
jgi:hypothetical protein